jgi:hypothetical protein
MMFMWSALVVGLAAFGQAILLPPSVSSADTDIINTLPFDVKIVGDSRTLNLECSKCPVVTLQPDTGVVWVDGIESKLELDFAIVQGEFDILQLNGVQIYPPRDLPFEPLGAFQLTSDPRDGHYLRLGYELDVTPVVKSEQDQLDLIEFRLQIIEIGDKFVDGLESVVLHLVKTPTGKLMIGDLYTAPTTNPGGKDCNTLFCKLRKVLTDKLSHVKPSKVGCGSKSGPKPTSKPHTGSEHGAHRHHKHHGLRRILHMFKKVALHVIIPVFIGIAAGFMASLIGMFVGQSAVFLWRTFYRRGQKGAYSRVQQEETDIVGKDQEKSLLVNQDAPPVYEEIVRDEKSTA